MSPSDRQSRSENETKQYAEREVVLADIRERYARFGERVVAAIIPYATRFNGMRELVMKLPFSNAARTDSQFHEVVTRFLANEGVSRFLELVVSPEKKEKTVQPSPATQPVTPAVVEPQVISSRAESTRNEKIWTDRRSGVERRSGKDRRDAVDMIFKNKRFGGDRRTGKDRRKKQIPPPWPGKEE